MTEKRTPWLRDRWFLGLLGLVALTIPLAVALVRALETRTAELQTPDLPPMPSIARLEEVTRQFDPGLKAPRLRLAYEPKPHPQSGLLSLYRVIEGDSTAYRLAVVRHDIACATCRDLLVAVFIAPGADRIEGIVSLAPWELAAGMLDPAAFLAQFDGRSLLDSVRVGREVDGVTGASLSVEALLTELWALGKQSVSALGQKGSAP